MSIRIRESKPTKRAAGTRPPRQSRSAESRGAFSPRHGLAGSSPRLGLTEPRGGNALPDRLRTAMEAMSGLPLADVQVHRNSPEPARVQALAYTHGNQIHLGPGQDKHLAHEAWHVVQQKQGRVRPTLQLKGLSVSDDAGLEREADRMGEAAATGLPDRPAPRSAAIQSSIAPVLQRKVGFEFETGWLVSANNSWLKKKDKVGTGAHQGFSVEADEAEAGTSEIEFVVYPPVEEGAKGFNVLAAVMEGVTAYAQRLVAAKVADKQPFALDAATGRQGDSVFAVTPRGGMEAGPQVTTGLDLAKIGRLGSISHELGQEESPLITKLTKARSGGPAPKELQRTLDSLQANAEQVSGLHSGISPQLQGLLVLIRNYLKAGANANKDDDLTLEQRTQLALNYPKRIGDVVLARTDFAKLFMLLPRGERRRFTAKKDSWVPFVLKGLAHVDPDDSVIERGIQLDENDPRRGFVKPDLKVKDWLLGMVGADENESGVDRLKTVPGAESMGEMGAKTEKVGGQSDSLFSGPVEAGIFEFRGAQAQKIPLNRWAPFALEFHRYISAVHD